MRFAYADPPYLGCGKRLYGDLHPDAADYDDPETHRALIGRLVDEYPDGWALSLHAPSLRTLLPMCPEDVRVMSWVKTWHQIRPLVPVQYAWEPVIVRGGRSQRHDPMVRDWVMAGATRMRGTPGAKPDDFCFWLFRVLGAEAGDEFVDLFPGSGAVGEAWERYCGTPSLFGGVA